MPRMTFEEMVRIELVSKHAEAAAEFVREQFLDTIGMELNCCMRDAPLESPLEAVFLFWWHALSTLQHITRSVVPVPQREVAIRDRRYRLDFALEPEPSDKGWFSSTGVDLPLVCVELDGHEFHERTRDQVIYRNLRDRDLQASGWLVLHYSGSELVTGPQAVIYDCSSKAEDAFFNARERHFIANRREV